MLERKESSRRNPVYLWNGVRAATFSTRTPGRHCGFGGGLRMPALFAYLIALALLLGGGYGALSWLAAPEPVKVVANTKPKPPHDQKNAELTSPDPGPSQASPPEKSSALGQAEQDQDKAASADQSLASRQTSSLSSEAQLAASAQDTPAQASRADQNIRSADQGTPAPAAVDQAPQRSAALAAKAMLENSRRATATESAVSHARADAAAPTRSATAKPNRPLVRPASHHAPDRRGLALMTLRTIEFPDGRRITELIPYRGGERAMAFEPDE
jgi:hypothetical protein